MDSLDLPEDWKLEELSLHVARLEAGTRPKGGVSKYTSGVPSISAEQILPDGQFSWVSIKHVPESFYHSATRGRIRSDDILIVKDGATTGKTAYVGKDFPHPKAMVNEHTFILRLKKSVLPRWVFYYFRSSYLREFWEAVRAHGIIGGLTQSFPNQVEIPIPPLSEQRRIVARIEELTKRLDHALQVQKQAVAEGQTYLSSAIARVFSEGSLSGWVSKKVKQICRKPQYGYTESASAEPIGPKFVRITDIQGGKVDWDNVPYCQCSEIEKYRLRSGDILFARTGATTGKSYLVENPPEAVFASYLIRLRAKDEILPEFLFWYFQSSSYWAAVFTGIDDGNRPNMNGTKLANVEIPYPPGKTEQRRIVDYLNGLRDKADQLKRLQAEVEKELDSFLPALLAKAFRGEL